MKKIIESGITAPLDRNDSSPFLLDDSQNNIQLQEIINEELTETTKDNNITVIEIPTSSTTLP